jgi:hypothetical protein
MKTTLRGILRAGFGLALVVYGAMAFDCRENPLVARLLAGPPPSPDPDLAAAASHTTVLKSMFTTVAMTIFAILVLIWLLRERQGHRRKAMI